MGDTERDECGLDRVHHRRRAADMHPMGREIRHSRSEQGRIDPADAPGPRLVSRAAHGDGDAEIGVACLELGQFLSKNEVARRPEAEDQVHLARPVRRNEITYHAHQGRNSDAPADQYYAVRFLAAEGEGTIRRFDLDLGSDPEFVVQPPRDQSLAFAFDRDLDSVTRGR